MGRKKKVLNSVSDDMFRFVAEEAGSTVKLTKNGSPDSIELVYSTDGENWQDYTIDQVITLANIDDIVYLRAKTENSTFSKSMSDYYNFIMTGKIACHGNIQYLLDSIGERSDVSNGCYNHMFYNCTNLISAPELPATSLAYICYYYMFYGCTNLTTPPELPATTLDSFCYYGMFWNCTCLTTPPELPAITLASYCYQSMFQNCTSLTTPPELPAIILYDSCYCNMFQGCTSLTTLPELPAIVLTSLCYYYMFNGCSKIKLSATQVDKYQIPYRIPKKNFGIAESYALNNMFSDTGGTFKGTPEINTTYYIYDPYHYIHYNNMGHGAERPSKKIYEPYILTSEDLEPLDRLEEVRYSFIKWFYDEELTNEAHEGDPVTEDITLYAKWEIRDEVWPGDLITEDTTLYAHWYKYAEYTITYNTQWGQVKPKTILENEVIEAKHIPPLSKKFWEFQGWYYDEEYTDPVELGYPLTSDTTFYAKWRQLEGYKVIFDTLGKCFPPDSQLVEEGHTVSKPLDPSIKGYIFRGWSIDKYTYQFWDFNTPVISDLTLYAIFEIVEEQTPIDWTKSMKQTFEYYLVDTKTWKDSKRLTDIISSSINRDESTDTLGSASFTCLTDYNDIYIRTYLVAEQEGREYKECLGTHLVQTPERKYNGKRNDISLTGYTSLIELKNEYMPIGYTIRKAEQVGENIENGKYLETVFYMLLDHMRAPTIEPVYDENPIFNHFIANGDDTYFSFINDLISYGKYYLYVDEYGVVSIKKEISIAALNPVWVFDTNNSSIIKSDITDKRDLYEVPNVVEVLYTDDNISYFISVTNNDPNSLVSTINRGRKVVYRETSPNIPENLSDGNARDYMETYALNLLESLSNLHHTITYSHGYCSVKLGDCVILNYPEADIHNIKVKIISQNIECSTGCMIEESSEYTEPLWTTYMKCEIKHIGGR